MEKHTIEMDSKVLRFVSDRIIDGPTGGIPTYNLQGMSDKQLQGLVEKYHELNIVKREKLNIYTNDSEPILFLNLQIEDLKISITKSLSEHQHLNKLRYDFLNREADSLKGILQTIPRMETLANKLLSKSELDQKIQQFLAQKKLETQIVNAAITPLATILDRANYSDEPLKPIPQSCYLLSTIFSFIAGTFAIIVIHLYNPFVYTKEHIEELSSIPILGVVNKSYTQPRLHGSIIVIKDFPRSSFSESLRFLRGNLNFLSPEKGKVICITSAVSGEGKSFISINLAYALTLIQKKVIVIAADLRKSEIHLAFDLPNEIGLSKYLSGQTNITSVITKTPIIELDIITAGPIPPNPSELLQNQMMKLMIHELRQIYDIILIDSAPVGLVSDIKPVLKLADINLFVMRSGVSRPAYTQIPQQLKDELNLKSIAIILNDFKSDNFHNHYYKDSLHG